MKGEIANEIEISVKFKDSTGEWKSNILWKLPNGEDVTGDRMISVFKQALLGVGFAEKTIEKLIPGDDEY